MKVPDTLGLFDLLDAAGRIDFSSLVVRVGASMPDVMESLKSLEEKGMVSIEGDRAAVYRFAKKAAEQSNQLAQRAEEEDREFDSEEFEKWLFLALERDENEDAADSVVSVTKDGFVKGLRVRSAGRLP